MYARKVALLQVLKYMPSSIELANAITVSHAAEEGKGAVIEGDFVTVSNETVDQDTGEITQQSARPTLPELTDEQFGKSLAGWRILVETGRKTADEIVAMVSSKNNMSQDQIAMLQASAVPV
jgi:recombination protein RecT